MGKAIFTIFFIYGISYGFEDKPNLIDLFESTRSDSLGLNVYSASNQCYVQVRCDNRVAEGSGDDLAEAINDAENNIAKQAEEDGDSADTTDCKEIAKQGCD